VSVDISEIRPDDRSEVDALIGAENHDNGAATGNTNLGATQCRSVLSLVARDERKIVGAILCHQDDNRGYIHQLMISDPPQYPDLAKALVDKALLKLNAQGTHRCRIHLSEDSDKSLFWEAVKWQSLPDLQQEPTPSSAVLDRLVQQECNAPPPDQDSDAAILNDLPEGKTESNCNADDPPVDDVRDEPDNIVINLPDNDDSDEPSDGSSSEEISAVKPESKDLDDAPPANDGRDEPNNIVINLPNDEANDEISDGTD